MKTSENELNDKRRILRFGVLCSGTKLTSFQSGCLKKLLAMEKVNMSLLLTDEAEAGSSINEEGYSRPQDKISLWSIYSRFILKLYSRTMKLEDISIDLKDVSVMKIMSLTDKSGSRYLSLPDIEGIRKYDLDFIINFGPSEISGEILMSPRYGVWSFCHSDKTQYHGIPNGFWEIYKNDNVSGALLLRLTNGPDEDIILREGFFKTIKTSYVRNIDNILLQSTEWPANVCADILYGNADYFNEPSLSTSAPVYEKPRNLQVILFLLIIIKNKFIKLFDGLFYSSEWWNIGVVNSPIHEFLDQAVSHDISWLPKPKYSKFIADPFGLKKDKTTYILYEDYDYKYGRGGISAACIRGDNISTIKNIIETPFHMSYPYILEHNNDIYCIPEVSASGNVTLYRADDFPEKWTRASTLIENFAGVDCTVFKYNDYWWLMATDAEDAPYHKLKIWYAEDLLGPWVQHYSNPVKIDVRSARPAGTPFLYNGYLYRPSQDCSGDYGGRIVLNRVLLLTPYDYKEEEVTVIEPDKNGHYPDGLHTISSVGDITLIDGKKKVFIGRSLYMVLYKIRGIKKILFS